MNVKTIKRKLMDKHRELIASIEDTEIAQIVSRDTFITGGSIVSLLLNEEPNDYDIYFTDADSCEKVARYYMDKLNKSKESEDFKYHYNIVNHGDQIEVVVTGLGNATAKYKEGYNPFLISTNAITLSDDIQLILRFVGKPEIIHLNYDFDHCKCYFIPSKNELVLPQSSLKSILTKEIRYTGSRYPLASIIRTRKFIKRGWNINAGQYVKMAFQLQEFDLSNPVVLKDQLTGVDLTLFRIIIDHIQSSSAKGEEITLTFLNDLIDQVFDDEYKGENNADEEE